MVVDTNEVLLLHSHEPLLHRLNATQPIASYLMVNYCIHVNILFSLFYSINNLFLFHLTFISLFSVNIIFPSLWTRLDFLLLFLCKSPPRLFQPQLMRQRSVSAAMWRHSSVSVRCETQTSLAEPLSAAAAYSCGLSQRGGGCGGGSCAGLRHRGCGDTPAAGLHAKPTQCPLGSSQVGSSHFNRRLAISKTHAQTINKNEWVKENYFGFLMFSLACSFILFCSAVAASIESILCLNPRKAAAAQGCDTPPHVYWKKKKAHSCVTASSASLCRY